MKDLLQIGNQYTVYELLSPIPYMFAGSWTTSPTRDGIHEYVHIKCLYNPATVFKKLVYFSKIDLEAKGRLTVTGLKPKSQEQLPVGTRIKLNRASGFSGRKGTVAGYDLSDIIVKWDGAMGLMGIVKLDQLIVIQPC